MVIRIDWSLTEHSAGPGNKAHGNGSETAFRIDFKPHATFPVKVCSDLDLMVSEITIILAGEIFMGYFLMAAMFWGKLKK